MANASWEPIEDLARLVAYEFEMMERAAEFRRESLSMKRGGRRKHLLRVYQAAFLIHYRNAMYFLAPTKGAHPTDITAGPFLGEGLTYAFPGTPVAHRDAVNALVAHLSTERLERDERYGELDPEAMFPDMQGSIKRFIECLGENFPERKHWFTEGEHWT